MWIDFRNSIDFHLHEFKTITFNEDFDDCLIHIFAFMGRFLPLSEKDLDKHKLEISRRKIRQIPAVQVGS